MSYTQLIQWKGIFPDPAEANPEGLLAAGGKLHPDWLIEAYCSGIFPWFSEEDPILWWSPNPRTILIPDEIKISDSLRRRMNRDDYQVRIDSAFNKVIRICATIERKDEHGTWINSKMIKAYEKLHKLGLAHSFETWIDGELEGGLYGVGIGKVFFGESMFHRKADASKIALVHLSKVLGGKGFQMIDVQLHTKHLESMGAKNIPRSQYLMMLKSMVQEEGYYGSWGEWI